VSALAAEIEVQTTSTIVVNTALRVKWWNKPTNVVGFVFDVTVDGDEYTQRVNLSDADAVRLVKACAIAFGPEWIAKVLAEEDGANGCDTCEKADGAT
jgi:hypothetical protein